LSILAISCIIVGRYNIQYHHIVYFTKHNEALPTTTTNNFPIIVADVPSTTKNDYPIIVADEFLIDWTQSGSRRIKQKFSINIVNLN
jgi:hypothetical protein